MFELDPWRYLSVGSSTGSSLIGAGRGVAERENGFDEGESIHVPPELIESLVDVELVESEELCLDLLRLLLRNERDGSKYVGKMDGGSDDLREMDID